MIHWENLQFHLFGRIFHLVVNLQSNLLCDNIPETILSPLQDRILLGFAHLLCTVIKVALAFELTTAVR